MENLNESCFAYTSMRKYPIHTKEAALNSYAVFMSDRDHYEKAIRDEITANFEKAASYHGFTLNAQEKKASVVQEDILELQRDGAVVAMSKISSMEDFSNTVSWILEKRASAPRVDLQEPAKYALWYAANNDIDMDTQDMVKIAHIAGVGVGDREKIVYELEKRASMLVLCEDDSKAMYGYIKEAKELPDAQFYKEATLNTLCNAIEAIDRAYNMSYRYGKDLTAPEDIVFEKTASNILEEASDIMLIPSVDTVISKKALLERADKVKSFFDTYMGIKNMSNDSIFEKVASLDAKTAEILLESIE